MRLDITYLVLCSSLAYAVSALPVVPEDRGGNTNNDSDSPRAPNSVSYLGPIMTISNNTAGDSQTMTNFVAKAGTPVKSVRTLSAFNIHTLTIVSYGGRADMEISNNYAKNEQVMTNVYGETSHQTITNHVQPEHNDKPMVKAGGTDHDDVGASTGPHDNINIGPSSGTGISNSRSVSSTRGRDPVSTNNDVNRTPKVVPSGQSISSSGSKNKKRVSNTDVPRRNTSPK
ncbi:hypothetical protein F5878DRAFT_439824 [Lentinula raphanica]|uniref:Uncharacterized protein n=1 Tax=Lentinula raphanica TaxID=153919 RepID=A0AA38NYD0_9AGAR|nr:hypothetical protein F5878DRAFT_439824 [Lentinula raphanica]